MDLFIFVLSIDFYDLSDLFIKKQVSTLILDNCAFPWIFFNDFFIGNKLKKHLNCKAESKEILYQVYFSLQAKTSREREDFIFISDWDDIT